MIQLDEWHVRHGVRDQIFLDATDSWSQATADFGAAVLSAWPISKLTAFGPLLEESRVWMHQDYAQESLWAKALEALIQHRYARRFSVLLLNTWPADYKAAEARKIDWHGRCTWDHQRSTLGRLARQTLHVKPLPAGGPEGDQ